MTPKPYNFRKPDRPAGTLEQRLLAWLRAAGALAGERAGHELPFRLEVAPRGVESLPPAEALGRLPAEAVAHRAAFDGEPPSMLFIWPRPLALALVNGALGETPAKLPDDRDLTAVEQSLAEYLMQNLLAAVLGETWAGAASMAMAVREREPSPRWTRLFVKAEQVVQCTFTVRGPFGEQVAYWLAPHAALNERVARAAALPAGAEHDTPGRLEALVRALPVEVTAELGVVELPLSQLAGLAPGDLLILNQRVAEPLVVRVDGRPKFRGWPGRVGSRQSLQIESLRE